MCQRYRYGLLNQAFNNKIWHFINKKKEIRIKDKKEKGNNFILCFKYNIIFRIIKTINSFFFFSFSYISVNDEWR